MPGRLGRSLSSANRNAYFRLPRPPLKVSRNNLGSLFQGLLFWLVKWDIKLKGGIDVDVDRNCGCVGGFKVSSGTV